MLRWFAATDPGKVRTANQDGHEIFALGEPAQGHIFAVADGMGGHQGGDVASRLALSVLKQFLLNWQADLVAPPTETVVAGAMAAGLAAANEHLAQAAADDPRLTGMGTTLTAVFLRHHSFALAHVGDSRLYKITAPGGLVQLTTDHALVAELVRAGQLTAEQARSHPQRHVLTEALGLPRPPQVQTAIGTLAAGEGLLLCTDGLTNTMADEEIGTMLRNNPRRPGQLIDLANRRGGPDNVTLVVVWPDLGGQPT